MSVHPESAGRGLGTLLLAEVAARAREPGYTAITGTTFRDLAFNAPFYARLGCVEEAAPHPSGRTRLRARLGEPLSRRSPVQAQQQATHEKARPSSWGTAGPARAISAT